MIILALICCLFAPLAAKVLVITHSHNRPDFIEIQERTFRKFLKDDYEFVVFNDARSQALSEEIRATCERLHIACVRIPQKIHDKPYLPRMAGEDFNHPCVRCANVVQYSLDVLGFNHDGLVMVIDSDMFMIQDFSLIDFMDGMQLAGLGQSRGSVNYIWNGLVFFDMPRLPDRQELSFNCGRIEGQPTDVGGYTFYYFLRHPDLRLKLLDVTYIGADHMPSGVELTNENLRFLLDQKPSNVEFLLHHTFFHYRGGGNWDHQSGDYHKRKTGILNEFIERILND